MSVYPTKLPLTQLLIIRHDRPTPSQGLPNAGQAWSWLITI